MLFRKKAEAEDIAGFLDQGTEITGELQFTGTLRLDGNFHGTISTADVLVVGEHAAVHGDIRAGEIVVHGRISGNILASRRAELCATSRVRADVRTPALVVHSGAIVDGRISMSSAEEVNPAEAGRLRAEMDETH